MPKLSDERRKKFTEYESKRKAFWDKIESKYHKSEKRHAECRLCGEQITVISPVDVLDALEAHEKTHPEYEEWIALGREFDLSNLHDILHDHDCIFVKCSCICGCDANICVAELPEDERNKPMLCSLCELYQNRGHVEHRLPDNFH